jgi:chemotaxis protein methyltransferase CheR
MLTPDTDIREDQREGLLALATLLQRQFGFAVAPTKLSVALSRALPVLHAQGVAGLDELVGYLRAHEDRLWEPLIPFLTVKETYFMREPRQLKSFVRLAEKASKPRTAGQPLHVLSAGCATGEEAYTLAILLAEAGARGNVWGIDVDAAALVTARAATYGPHAFRGVPDDWRKRHFESVALDRWRVLAEHRKHVQFRQANLTRLGPITLATPFDAIFCRNVLIYFARPTQMTVVGRLARLLRPSGVLFLGHSEVFLDRASELGLRYDEELAGYRPSEKP